MNSKITKMILEFNNQEAASIKSFAIKKSDHVKVRSFFIRENAMFAKLLLMSFIYEMLETFCFPDKKRQIIF